MPQCAEMKIDTAWFRELIRISPFRSQKNIAAQIKGKSGKPLAPEAITLMLQGKRVMQIEEAKQIADLLKVPLAEVLAHAGIKGAERPDRRFHISGYLTASGDVRLEDASRGVDGPHDLPKDAIVIQTKGIRDAAFEGWTLYASRPIPYAKHFIGRLCIVELRGGQRKVGILVSESQRKVGLRPFLAKCEILSDIQLKWIAPVLWVRPR